MALTCRFVGIVRLSSELPSHAPAVLTFHTMAHRYTSEEGARARRQRGARAAHESMRAQGRVPGAEATLAAQLRRLAASENGAAGMDYSDDATVDVLAGIDE